jgi:DNA-binding PadR family transcriptional regulator
MSTTAKDPNSLLPLTPAVFHILLALADRERHGYGIMQEVQERTNGEVKLGPGTLYGAIKRLIADGLIAESDQRPDPAMDDERRTYYKLTPFGLKVTQAEVNRLAEMVAQARSKRLIPGSTFAL